MEGDIRYLPCQPRSARGQRHVLLIAGNERRFAQDVEACVKFYLHQGASALTLMYTAYMDGRLFYREMRRAIGAAGTLPLLIVYSGHGDRRGWAYTVPGHYPYRTLCEVLAARSSGNTLVVNACCHALSIAGQIEKTPELTARVSVIAACEAEETTSVSLVSHVLERWGASRPFVPKQQRIQKTLIDFSLKSQLVDGLIELPPPKVTNQGEYRVDLGERRWGPQFDRQFYLV